VNELPKLREKVKPTAQKSVLFMLYFLLISPQPKKDTDQQSGHLDIPISLLLTSTCEAIALLGKNAPR
jgi:hypothetical protein